MQCKSCGAQNPDNLMECAYCGASLSRPTANSAPAAPSASVVSAPAAPAASSQNQDYAIDLPQYYKAAFAEFDKNPQGGPQFKFNWGAFWFGPFWYFFRGLWLKGILYLAVIFGTAGFLVWLPWIYSFSFGTYDLYLLRKHGKQFW
ncbi:DUF2628 domain-containing protein [Polynucleobacter sp. MWH-Spelu-300-X4]|uniref:DUF2628 domain-containing protein n=1 Tax=Polynucleobacter sp. MWH-Spelu-300-X4 TaxID=2689109 RepID=UPI001BFCFF4D|nr:DUF2628 domain-containing protein [Polynucleobacter sp. MWH-Spelu-300-X4]QWD80519.1 DUF2628 domain-containing protein [Polynucleobacter sp. MWH-Spelu-300-X4]